MAWAGPAAQALSCWANLGEAVPDETVVSLRQPSLVRWSFSARQRASARKLVSFYMRDLGVDPGTAELIESAAREVVPLAYLQEMEGIANSLELPCRDIMVTNLYYDALKHVLGCTAVAVDTPDGPLHARNLDWWTEGSLLSTATLVTKFTGAPAGPFMTVGWPGFAGAFSGLAVGRFSISLNAVLSGEPPGVAVPVVFLIRHVLETTPTYEEALAALSNTPIASDCLLLLAGTEPGQMAIIERTPSRFAVRTAVDGAVWATNDYKQIDADSGEPVSDLQVTSCGRYDRMGHLLRRPPRTLDDCLAYLSDDDVRMLITVQQMAFHARTGRYLVKAPGTAG